MIFIGVTGGIGSGKSLVCSLFEKKNIPVFYADIIAKEITDNDLLVRQEIVDSFGSEVLDSSTKKINRKKLAEIVFADESKIDKLNSIIHPRVFDKFEEWKATIPKTSHYALVEAALMFESEMDELLDYVLAVTADEKVRIARVKERDKSTEDQIQSRMKFQITAEELLELSDFVLQNNGTKEELVSQINFFDILFSTLTERKEIE